MLMMGREFSSCTQTLKVNKSHKHLMYLWSVGSLNQLGLLCLVPDFRAVPRFQSLYPTICCSTCTTTQRFCFEVHFFGGCGTLFGAGAVV